MLGKDSSYLLFISENVRNERLFWSPEIEKGEEGLSMKTKLEKRNGCDDPTLSIRMSLFCFTDVCCGLNIGKQP